MSRECQEEGCDADISHRVGQAKYCHGCATNHSKRRWRGNKVKHRAKFFGRARQRKAEQRYDAWILVPTYGTASARRWVLWFHGGKNLAEVINTAEKLSGWWTDALRETISRVEVRDGAQTAYVLFDSVWGGKRYATGTAGNIGGPAHFQPSDGRTSNRSVLYAG